MIFFGGSGSLLIPNLQRLAAQKISKNRQNTKANLIFILRNIDLAAKTPQKGHAFSVSTNLLRAALIYKVLR